MDFATLELTRISRRDVLESGGAMATPGDLPPH